MSGLFGEAQVIAQIVDDWERHLRAKHPGQIRYFKMDEAVTLDGEFRHWQPQNRDAKVLQMANLLNRSDIMRVGCSIDVAEHAFLESEWTFVRGHHAFNQPYLLGIANALSGAAEEAVDRGSTFPMEVIFDNQDLFKPMIMENYPALRDVFPESHKAVLPLYPMFRDDKDYIFLQAADLISGERRLIGEAKRDNPEWVGKLCPELPTSKFFRDFNQIELRQTHARLKTRVEAALLHAEQADASERKARAGDHD